MLENVNVLIVDDEETNREILIELIKKLSLTPMTAKNGKEALLIFKTKAIDLILMDIQMPEMDGYAALEAMKKIEGKTHIPIIMITSVDEMESIVRCLKAGADDYLIKPFEPEILKARISNALDKLRYTLAEKDFLDRTLSGSIKVLTDILSMVNPQVFGRSTKIRRMVRLIANQMGVKEIGQIEIATMLSQLGGITLPVEIFSKLADGKPLFPEEKALLETHPKIAYDLLIKLPRLEEIARIIFYQNKPFDGRKGEVLKQDGKYIMADDIPLASRIIHLALDFEVLSAEKANAHEVIEKLRGMHGEYDPKVIDALEKVLLNEVKREIKELKINEITEGMIFAQEVRTNSGTRLAASGQEASFAVLARIKNISKKVTIPQPIKMIMPIKW